MDRFIGKSLFLMYDCFSDLKSNMDRFIGNINTLFNINSVI